VCLSSFSSVLWVFVNLFIIYHLVGCATLVVFIYNVGDWITIWHLNYWGHHRYILYTSFINDRLSINGGHSCRMIKSISTVGISSLITCIYFGVVTKSEAEIFPGYRTLSLVKSRSHECQSWSLGKVMRHLFLLFYLMDAVNDSKWSIYRPKLYRRRFNCCAALSSFKAHRSTYTDDDSLQMPTDGVNTITGQ
jgi:hypothetical protein